MSEERGEYEVSERPHPDLGAVPGIVRELSEEPMILHASDEVLGMMGIEALHRRLAELERERDEAREQANRDRLIAAICIKLTSDHDSLKQVKADALVVMNGYDAMRNALTLSESALAAVEWEAPIDDVQFCVWCGTNRKYGHESACARQAALSAIRSVRQ